MSGDLRKGQRVGFVGFGEAGFHLAKGLRSAGVEQITAFDLHWKTPGKGELICDRAAATQTTLVPSHELLAEASDVILSTVTADQALQAARQTIPHLGVEHLYADLNSVSPLTKKAIAEVVEEPGAMFAEVAVMAAVPPLLHKVPMLLGGTGAEAFAHWASPLGMNVEVVGVRVGDAAATKMCRSIVIKGIEALLTECVLTATEYGVDERVLASFDKTFPGLNWKKLASYLVSRVAVHGERRAREMEEVAATIKDAGFDPFMAEATVRLMDWAADLHLRARFGDEGPTTYEEFVDAVTELQPPAAARG